LTINILYDTIVQKLTYYKGGVVMNEKLIGIQLVRLSNAIRRMTFNESICYGDTENRPTGTQEMFLAYISAIDNKQDIIQKDLEGWFNIRRSTATEILKRMEQKELIIRIPVEYDKRIKKIILTDKARKICKENYNRILKTEKKLARGFSEEELCILERLLKKVENNIE